MKEVLPNFHPKFWITEDGGYNLADEDPNTIREKEVDSLYEGVIIKGRNHYSFDHLREYVLLSLYRKDYRLQSCELCNHFKRRNPEAHISIGDRCEVDKVCGHKFNNCPSFVLKEEGANDICNRKIEVDVIFCQPLSFQKRAIIDREDNLLKDFTSQKKPAMEDYEKLLEDLYKD